MESFGENILIKSNLQLEDIGVVIPTFNEADYLAGILSDLKRIGFSKICVVDAGSSDGTIGIAKNYDACTVETSVKSKAHQLNEGAKQLQTPFYLFIHADVRLINVDATFFLENINSKGFSFGNFKLRFESKHWFLGLNEKFSHFKFGAFQFGDQGLLVDSQVFKFVNGYNEELIFMEGNDIVRRLRKEFKFTKMDKKLLVSARKYEEIGVFRLQFTYFIIYFLARLGVPQSQILQKFKSVFG